ncbi:MAG: cytochrome c family protein [Pseudomonadota bacterium]|nr:cytochrome c family protein [Pseudomonadota bacterium]
MNGFELNKLIAAGLLAVLVAMLAGFLAKEIVAPEALEKNVYVVEGAGQPATAAATTAPAGPPKIEAFLAKADIDAGQKTARVCGTCHSFGKGEAAKMGPNLYGIIGAKHGHMDGFNYSDAMKAMAGNWDFDELNEFLFNPRAHVPGTKMTFAGIKNDQDRANVIAWLNTIADKPAALPK